MKEQKESKRSGLKRTLLEWLGIGAVIAILYFTGLHTEVLGTMQRAMLWTGLFDAEVEEIEAKDGPTLPQSVYDFSLYRPNGEQLSFKAFKGKVLFINVWASWCPPCLAEMPTIETLYEEVAAYDNIEFLLISLDQDPQKAINFMDEGGFPMPFYFPAANLPAAFRSSYIPSTYVISAKGKIIYKQEGIADYSSRSFRNWLIDKAKHKEHLK